MGKTENCTGFQNVEGGEQHQDAERDADGQKQIEHDGRHRHEHHKHDHYDGGGNDPVVARAPGSPGATVGVAVSVVIVASLRAAGEELAAPAAVICAR